MSFAIARAEVDAVVASGLLTELDTDFVSRYPDEPVNNIKPSEFHLASGYFVLARVGPEIAGCGAFRPHDQSTVEIKRMFVRFPFRKKGIARAMLKALETEAKRQGFTQSILETAKRMPEAIALYQSCGYAVIEPFGQYIGSARSVCMRSTL